MDNLTHSLVGAAVAESFFHRSPSARKPVQGPPVRLAFWIISILGNNLPDLDVLYAGSILDAPLGYLLHHRGHTHTLLLDLVQGLLLGLLGQFLLKRKIRKPLQWDKSALWALGMAGPFLHLAMDGLNNYGIHPFWPFWNAWLYGDALFIIEPLIWVALLPVVYFATKRRSFRWIAESFLVALFTAMWILPVTRWYSATGIVLFGGFVWLVTRGAKPRWRADFGLVAASAIVAVFSAVSTHSKILIEKENSLRYPNVVLHDIILTPYPSNPFCWNLITVETYSSGGKYRMRRGRFSPFPRWVSADQCPQFPSKGSTAFLKPVNDLWGADFAWEGQYVTSVGDLRDYADISCSWSAFLKFARAPFLQEEQQSLWAGDLRYDYGPELGFAEMKVPAQDPPCRSTPPWQTRLAFFTTPAPSKPIQKSPQIRSLAKDGGCVGAFQALSPDDQ